MDHAQEQGLWSALGAAEADVEAAHQRLDRMDGIMARLLRRETRRDLVLWIVAVMVAGQMLAGLVRGRVGEREAGSTRACLQQAGPLAVKHPAARARQDL